MIIRILADNEKNRIRALYEEVFDDTKEFVDYYFSSYVQNTFNFVCEENGDLVGMATIHTKRIMVSKNECKAGYVYAVATKSSHRGRGIMKSILSEIDEYAFENDYDYLYLIPVNPAIYEGLGYELVRCKKEIVVDLSYDKCCNDIAVKKLSQEDAGEFAEFAENFYENKVSILCNESYILENLQRLSIKNSGIYCILHKVYDKILGLAFVEDDDELLVDSLICADSDVELCMKAVADGLGADRITYKLHDIMFKSVHKSVDKLRNYSININDEV